MPRFSFVINYVILFLSLLIFLVNFFFYKFTFATLFINYIILITSLTFFFVSKKYKKNYFIIEISIVLTLLLINFILYFEPIKFLEKNHIKKFIKINKLNIIYDERSRSDIYFEDLKANIKPHRFPQLNNSNTINDYFTFSNFSNSIVRHCNESGKWLKYKTDKYGFNNENVSYNKKIDVIFLGDSFFEAHCVERKDNTSSLLSEKSGKNIVNLSVSGSGPLDYLGIYKEYGKNLNPKEIYIFFYEKNDLRDLEERLKYSSIKKYLNRDHINYGYTDKISQIDYQLSKQFDLYFNGKNEKKNNSYFENFINFFTLLKTRIFIQNLYISYNWDNQNYFLLKKNEKILKKIFREFKYLSDHDSFKVNFVYVPSANFINKNKQSKIKDLLFSIVREDLNPHNFIDLEFHLDNYDHEELYPFGLKNRHFSENGHKIISEYLYKKIKY